MKTIKIARDFSKFPAGRFAEYGPFTGEAFRKKLVEALRGNKTVCVDLDGTAGYGSSFLEEAFGGLVRKEGFTAPDLRTRLSIVCTEEPSLIQEIWADIDNASTAGIEPKKG